MGILFTSDLHLGHKNILPSRPQFSNIEEHDQFLIDHWNKKVRRNDDVYILGDFSFSASNPVAFYLNQLKGRKHLIIGNHDYDWLKKINPDDYFESVTTLAHLKFDKKKMTLCHFPMLEWSGSRYINGSSFLIHGHIHNQTDSKTFQYIKENLPHALNAGVDINHWEPVDFEELKYNNEIWYEREKCKL